MPRGQTSCNPRFGVNGNPIGEGAGAMGQPSLVPREIKLSRPSTFSGKKTEVDNFIFEMR